MNANLEKCLQSALDEAYLQGYRDSADKKPSRVSEAISKKLAEKPKEFIGKWLSEGGMFVEVESHNGKHYVAYLYDELGNKLSLIHYDDNGKTELGKPFNLKNKLNGSVKEEAWPQKRS